MDCGEVLMHFEVQTRGELAWLRGDIPASIPGVELILPEGERRTALVLIANEEGTGECVRRIKVVEWLGRSCRGRLTDRIGGTAGHDPRENRRGAGGSEGKI